MKKHTFILLILSVFSSLQAQEMVTDRPDFTESALVVPKGMIQVESGVEYNDLNAFSERSCPMVLARMGLGRDLEVRFGFSGWTGITVGNTTNT